jgi:hypothetical protein
MSIRYHTITTVSAVDYKALRQLWEVGGVDLAEGCILRVQNKPRTAAQAERLGKLLASVKVRKSDYSPESLTSLWILKDERGSSG